MGTSNFGCDVSASLCCLLGWTQWKRGTLEEKKKLYKDSLELLRNIYTINTFILLFCSYFCMYVLYLCLYFHV